MGDLSYFLGIVVPKNKNGILFSHQKYRNDLLIETKCEQLKIANTPLKVSIKLEPQGGDKLADPGIYRRLVGKLIYLTVTRSDVSFAVSVVSQFMQ